MWLIMFNNNKQESYHKIFINNTIIINYINKTKTKRLLRKKINYIIHQ